MHEDLVRLAEVDRLDRELRRVDRAVQAAHKDVEDHEQGVVQTKAHLTALEATRKASRGNLHQAERRAKRYRDRRASANKVLQSGVGDFSAAERQLTECARILDEVEGTLCGLDGTVHRAHFLPGGSLLQGRNLYGPGGGVCLCFPRGAPGLEALSIDRRS